MLAAVLLPFGMVAFHRSSGYPIVMVITDGYTGPVRLIIDEYQGAEVPLENDKYTYHIPKSGTLLIKDGSPFRRWHSMTATYKNGVPIPIDNERTRPADAISLHYVGSGVKTHGGKECIEYIIGTKADLYKYREERLKGI